MSDKIPSESQLGAPDNTDIDLDAMINATESLTSDIVTFFQGLKNICSLYLIGTKDSKELGKLISDLNKFQGIFTQEEIYEFVQRRQDWIAVKRDVEKVMYGLGVKDCTIM